MGRHPRSRRDGRRHDRGERGSILIPLAIGVLSLMAVTWFVYEQGFTFVGRQQVQNAADAAALAVAVSFAYDEDPEDPEDVAWAVVASHRALGDPLGDVLDPSAVTVPDEDCDARECIVRVDVNPNDSLKPWMRATATARMVRANATQCLKPWAVADRWEPEERYASEPYNPEDPDDDDYDADSRFASEKSPAAGGPGHQLVLRLSNAAAIEIRAGLTVPLPLGSDYGGAVAGCAPGTVALDDRMAMMDVPMDAHVGAVNQLLAGDPFARWDDGLRSVVNVGPDHAVSPRIVPVAVFHTDNYYNQIVDGRCPGIDCRVRVVNIAGFFIEGFCSTVAPVPPACADSQPSDVVGRLMNIAGVHDEGAPSASRRAFGRVVSLVR